MLNLLKSSREKKDCAARVAREAYFDRDFEFQKAVKKFYLNFMSVIFSESFFSRIKHKISLKSLTWK